MSVTNDLTLINDISNFKLGHGVTFVCDVSSLISTYNNFKLYSVDNNDELTELVDVSDNITNGLLVYKYYPQSSGSLNIVLGTEEVSDTIHRSNTIQLRINNNSHAENIFNANAALVANLTSMGVLGASTNDGLATNIAKVTSIPPTQRGIELDTSITCFAPATASVGVPFNITGVLTSSYDDTSQANVDMHGGEIQGATIEIYNGNTLLGTCTTNIDGEYTFTYTPTVTGTLSIKAVYDSANDFYEDSASNSNSVSVHVAVSSVSLVTDKSILSYVDNEYATLTATVLDNNNEPVVGETVSFDIVDPDTGEVISNIDTATTNSNGECNVYYYSNHTCDLYIRASCNNISSTLINIESDYYYDPCTSDKGHWSSTTGLAFNSNGMQINGQADLDINYPTDFSLEFVISEPTSNPTDWTSRTDCRGAGFVGERNTSYWYYNSIGGYIVKNNTPIKSGTIKYIVENGTTSVYYNDTFMQSTNTDNNQKFGVGQPPYNSNWLRIKDIKLKEL